MNARALSTNHSDKNSGCVAGNKSTQELSLAYRNHVQGLAPGCSLLAVPTNWNLHLHNHADSWWRSRSHLFRRLAVSPRSAKPILYTILEVLGCASWGHMLDGDR